MKTSALMLGLMAAGTQAFAPINPAPSRSLAPSQLQMGLLDFFSPEAQKAREAKRQREIEEQERLQKEIMERRSNPAKMEEYEQKVQLRRQLRMAGQDDAASKIDTYEDAEKQTLLDGTQGSFVEQQ